MCAAIIGPSLSARLQRFTVAESTGPLRKHTSTRTSNQRLDSLRVGATPYLGKTPDFIGTSEYHKAPKFDICSESAVIFFSSLPSRLRGPNLGRAESAMDSASSQASPLGSPSMVASRYKLSCLMCLILLTSFELVASAENTAAPLLCKSFPSNPSLLSWMPLQTYEPSTDA